MPYGRIFFSNSVISGARPNLKYFSSSMLHDEVMNNFIHVMLVDEKTKQHSTFSPSKYIDVALQLVEISALIISIVNGNCSSGKKKTKKN